MGDVVLKMGGHYGGFFKMKQYFSYGRVVGEMPYQLLQRDFP